MLARKIESNDTISIDYQSVQTNIVKINIINSGITPQKMEEELFERGLRVKCLGNRYLRMTVYHGIDNEQIHRAADVFNNYTAGLRNRKA